MATLTKQTFTDQTSTIVETDLNSAPHNLAWESNTYLVMSSTEDAQITVNIKGDDATTVSFDGYGDVDVSAGYNAVIASGENVVIPLNKINKFLGTVKNNVVLTVTGSTAPDKAFVYWR